MFGWARNLFGMVVEGRSSQWPKVRAEHLKREDTCQWCGRSDNLEVHHVVPVHKCPQMELDVDNLLTLCGPCHWSQGHYSNWLSWNPTIRDDCHKWQLKRKNRP